MPQVKFPSVDTIHSKDHMFVTAVKIKATGGSKLNESPVGLVPIKVSVPIILKKMQVLQIKIISLQMVMVHNLPSPPLSATTSCPVIPKSILIKQCCYNQTVHVHTTSTSKYCLKPPPLKRRKLTHNTDASLCGFKEF